MNELYRYLTLAVSPEWRRLEERERAAQKHEFAAATANATARVHAYSLVGMRADADLLLWCVGDDLDALQGLEQRLASTALWSYSTRPYSYLAARRRSQYLADHERAGSEHARGTAGPVGDMPYVVVYPMTKKRSWYALPHEERRKLMKGHATVGREFAGKVKQLITGSTGLDDAEWGVTLFARDTFQIKAIVYKMRFDRVSAEYADFGEFFIGIQLRLDELFQRLQL